MLFKRKKITKDISIVDIISQNPMARGVLLENGIKFVGQGLSPLESLEKVAKGNGLDNKQIENILKELNKEQPKTSNKDVIQISSAAGTKLKEMIKSKNKKGIRLRLVSDGCATYVYDMDFGTRRIEGEIELKANGVTFYIDPKSADFIRGTKIDYDTKEEGFVFDNPNVKK